MRNGPGSGQRLVSPRIQFPVYGLDRSWPGQRWLELFGDEIGDPLRWVSLGHRSRDGDALVMVKTYVRLATGRPRSYQIPTDAQAAELGQDPLEWVAFSAAVPGAYLYATGLGTGPDGLSLAVLADGDAYHFDLGQPPPLSPAAAGCCGWPRTGWTGRTGA